jgi:hypothetical protein
VDALELTKVEPSEEVKGKFKPVVIRFQCCTKQFRLGDKIVCDDEGFAVCPDHKQRRYGWRSLPTKLVKLHKHPGSPTGTEDEFKAMPDYSFSFKPQAADRHVMRELGFTLIVEEVLEPELVPSA